MTNAVAHNGGTAQVNFNGLQTGGEFPFLNVLKSAQAWQLQNTGLPPNPTTINSDGYPTSLPDGNITTRYYVPPPAERSGNYKVTWTGTGNRVTYNGGFANLISGVDTVSGYVLQPTDTNGTMDLLITTLGGSGISNLQVFHVNDEPALNAGQVFGTQFETRLQEANFGVYRFLNWQSSNDTNISLWTHRKPITYVFYNGLEFRSGLYVSSAATLSGKTYSCAAPSTWPGLVHGAIAHIKFASSFATRPLAATFTNGSSSIAATAHGCGVNDLVTFSTTGALPTNFAIATNYYIASVPDANHITVAASLGGSAIVAGSAGSGTQTANFAPTVPCTFTNGSTSIASTTHSCSVNDMVRLNTNSALPTNFVTQTNYFVVSVPDADHLTLSATQGGSAITAGSAGSGTHTINPMPMLNIGSTSAVPVINNSAQTMRNNNLTYPVTGKIGTVVYDSHLNVWMLRGGNTAFGDYGLANGVPPEIMVQLCGEMGAHPYFISPINCLDPVPTGDYMSGLAAYCLNNAPSWMIPRYECSNETWNSSFPQTSYGDAKARQYGWNSTLDFYGKAASLLGQTISGVYGSPAALVRANYYHFILGLQTVSLISPTANNPYVDSTSYVSAGGSAAKSWATHLCCAQYIVPYAWNVAQETTLATAYAAGDLSAPITYVDTCLGPAGLSGTNKETVADLIGYYANLKTYAQSKGINKICGYEGGYSPDYINGESASVRNLKIASKQAPNVRAYLNATFQAFVGLTDTIFTAEFPSQYLIGDSEPSGFAWSALAGTVYSADTPAWLALKAWASPKRGSNFRLRIHG